MSSTMLESAHKCNHAQQNDLKATHTQSQTKTQGDREAEETVRETEIHRCAEDREKKRGGREAEKQRHRVLEIQKM